MGLVEPLVRDAVVYSSLLVMLSTGLTLTYMTTRVPNFSHGGFATIGVYITLTVGMLFRLNPYLSGPIAFLVSGLVALAMYMAILHPLSKRGASYLQLMIATIAFEFLIFSITNIYADYLTENYGRLVEQARTIFLRKIDFRIDLGPLAAILGFDASRDLNEPAMFFIAPTTTILSVILLHTLLTRTKFGTGMRAAIENPPLAEVVGINVRLAYAVSWFISGGLAGLAGSYMPLWFLTGTETGSVLLVSIFAASIVGGFQNLYGALLGGLVIGLGEILGTAELATLLGSWIIPYRPVIPLIAMSVALLFAPQGLTGLNWPSLSKVKVSGSAD
ncbi:MAG: branched-chain amino acid ABC transporter permease [Nitrososphaerota archaeon]